MTRALFAAALFLGLLVAGCTKPATEVEPECADLALCDIEAHFASHTCVKDDVRPRLYAPDTPGPDAQADPWALGDYWEYALVVDGEDLGTTRLVYYEDQDFAPDGTAQHYMVGTPTREEALHHALHSTNPVIGRVHRTLYSPHESGAHADMFHFPLCEGSSWSTRFFDTPFRMTASQEPVQAGSSQDPLGFRIEGTSTDGSTVTVLYSPQAKWFTLIDLDRADGLQVDMELTGHGSGARGDAFFLRGQKDVVYDLGLQSDSTVIERAPGKEGAYDSLGYALALERSSGSGKLEVHLRDPSGASVACVGIAGTELNGATDCPKGPLVGEADWVAGDWTLTVETSVLNPAEAAGEARVVSIYDRSGTV